MGGLKAKVIVVVIRSVLDLCKNSKTKRARGGMLALLLKVTDQLINPTQSDTPTRAREGNPKR
jgi:hypothetical protein